MISTDEALALVAHLPGLLHPPKLKKHWRRLAYDLLCLCSGMRATVMLDYMCIKPSQLAVLLADLFQRIRISLSLGVMYMGACSYVYHYKNLLSTGQATLDGLAFTTNFVVLTAEGAKVSTRTQSPVLLLLQSADGTISSIPRSQQFADPEQHDFIHEQLVHFLAHMSSSFDDMPAQAGRIAGQYLDLEGYCQEGQLPLPTLNGWLLGYPVVYYFKKQQEDAVTGLSYVNLLQLKLMLPRLVASSNFYCRFCLQSPSLAQCCDQGLTAYLSCNSKLLRSGPVLTKKNADSTDLDILLRRRRTRALYLHEADRDSCVSADERESARLELRVCSTVSYKPPSQGGAQRQSAGGDLVEAEGSVELLKEDRGEEGARNCAQGS
eukprot:SM000045S16278  [mRNA]  locus=s45:614056:617886:+ [translate_table: standard]